MSLRAVLCSIWASWAQKHGGQAGQGGWWPSNFCDQKSKMESHSLMTPLRVTRTLGGGSGKKGDSVSVFWGC